MEKMAMKNEKLTQDEYNALDEVKRGIKGERVSACVGRNTKRLAGIKLFTIAKNGRISLTDKGEEVLFLRRCILGLRAIEARAPRCTWKPVTSSAIASGTTKHGASEVASTSARPSSQRGAMRNDRGR
jgi:hypothetical protein